MGCWKGTGAYIIKIKHHLIPHIPRVNRVWIVAIPISSDGDLIGCWFDDGGEDESGEDGYEQSE